MAKHTKMTEEEMLAKIKELEEENTRLRRNKVASNIPALMKNEKELDFLSPYYDDYCDVWRASSVKDNFTYLRQLAVSVVDTVDVNNKVVKQKISNMNQEDLLMVAACADELVLVAAKYKKRYLESIGRTDIIEAFDM